MLLQLLFQPIHLPLILLPITIQKYISTDDPVPPLLFDLLLHLLFSDNLSERELILHILRLLLLNIFQLQTLKLIDIYLQCIKRLIHLRKVPRQIL